MIASFYNYIRNSFSKPADTPAVSRSSPSYTDNTYRGECDTRFIYVPSNEIDRGNSVRESLGHFPPPQNPIHLGIGGCQNLDFILWRGSEYAYIVDINPNMIAFHSDLQSCISQSQSTSDFITNFPSFMERTTSYIIEDRDRLLSNSMLWLENEENFQSIKNLYINDRIKVIQGDIHDPDTINQIMSQLNGNLDTFYISNVGTWLNLFLSWEDVGQLVSVVKDVAQTHKGIHLIYSTYSTSDIFLQLLDNQHVQDLKNEDLARPRQSPYTSGCMSFTQ